MLKKLKQSADLGINTVGDLHVQYYIILEYYSSYLCDIFWCIYQPQFVSLIQANAEKWCLPWLRLSEK